jgi:hypothetical protein
MARPDATELGTGGGCRYLMRVRRGQRQSDDEEYRDSMDNPGRNRHLGLLVGPEFVRPSSSEAQMAGENWHAGRKDRSRGDTPM